MDEVDKKLKEYREKFGKDFFIMRIGCPPEDELIRQIDECIRNNKPQNVDFDDDPFVMY